jgi:hypothetical protein
MAAEAARAEARPAKKSSIAWWRSARAADAALREKKPDMLPVLVFWAICGLLDFGPAICYCQIVAWVQVRCTRPAAIVRAIAAFFFVLPIRSAKSQKS